MCVPTDDDVRGDDLSGPGSRSSFHDRADNMPRLKSVVLRDTTTKNISCS